MSTTIDQTRNQGFDAEDYFQLVDYFFALNCRTCGSKVMDPDKKKNQLYLDGKCPSCGQTSTEKEPKKSKSQRKREKKQASIAAKKALKRMPKEEKLSSLDRWRAIPPIASFEGNISD